MVLRRDMDKRTERLIACTSTPLADTAGAWRALDVLSEDALLLGLCPHAEYVNITGAAHGRGRSQRRFRQRRHRVLMRTVPLSAPPVHPPHAPIHTTKDRRET